jgi:hypothetical protein
LSIFVEFGHKDVESVISGLKFEGSLRFPEAEFPLELSCDVEVSVTVCRDGICFCGFVLCLAGKSVEESLGGEFTFFIGGAVDLSIAIVIYAIAADLFLGKDRTRTGTPDPILAGLCACLARSFAVGAVWIATLCVGAASGLAICAWVGSDVSLWCGVWDGFGGAGFGGGRFGGAGFG